ncbi:tRNA pseudouridine(38/39) synthase isoform X2 [Sitophilus oryzae]|uniref:tRNA pseudouridine(38/39) synthase isoform X2 n=1 Tax=Sitophilus oryzae TaxID=7048 RepID=A0A6J2YP50_SITOR|nr:tRNA pseudouridine(38/39) synthase isoform X2 [Sitophilus oryzae]
MLLLNLIVTTNENKIAIVLISLGWNYQGFAVQEDTTNTIEYFLFEALIKTCLIKDRSSSNYNRCGRTDKGVSSFGQTISITVRSRLTKENEHELDKEINYCKVLNRVLPDFIQCISWALVPVQFSSRFDCISRLYRYYFVKGTLDIEAMRQASKCLIGSHDFRNFCKMDVGNGVVQFVRNILDFRIELLDNESSKINEYTIYVANIQGNAFLWHQIRYIMGILFLIGSKKENPDIINKLLDVKENPRKPDYHMANEVPLNLFRCGYENINWQYSKDNLKSVLETLRRIWVFKSIKVAMIEDIISNLMKQVDGSCELRCLSENLLNGVKTKKYVPVMKRQKCESLEDKIEHFSKRNRIELVSNENKK